jgi:uncharacterized membrane protein YbhN (UPF0104 family)
MPQKQSARQLIGLVITAVVLVAWGWFLYGQVERLNAYSWKIAPGWLALAILLATLYFVGLGIGWSILLRAMSGKSSTLTLFQGARVWQLSMFTRYIPGNVWHILSRAALAEQVQASRSLVIASATIEQLLTLLGALLLVPIALPYLAAQISLTGSMAGWLILLAVAFGLVAIHPLILGRLLIWMGGKFRRPEIAWRYKYRTMLGILCFYALITSVSGCSLVAIVIGLADIEMMHIPFIVGSAALAWAVGYLSFLTPSGLGVREGVLVGLLSLILPLPVAIVASLLFRLVSMAGELLSLGMFWLAVPSK